MAKISMLILPLVVVSSATAQLIPCTPPVSACKGDLSALTDHCAPYVALTGPQVPPSTVCCKAIQGADIPCICKTYITPGIEKLISMKKVVYVAGQCNRPFAHGSKCGDYSVPAAY